MVANRLNSATLEQRLADVIAGYLVAAEEGRMPDRQELINAHPDLASDLQEFFNGQDQFGRLIEPLKARDDSRPLHRITTCLEPERSLGDFRIVGEIGRGGMGVVYEAVQISLGRRVALKVLPFAAALDARQLQRFKNEAQAAAHLHHQNIVPVYAVGCERGVHFYAMQYIEGHTLASVIQDLHENDECRNPNDERSPNDQARMTNDASSAEYARGSAVDTPFGLRHSTLDLCSSFGFRHAAFFSTVARLALQATEALEHAHSVGIVHRDIKPANLLIDARGNLWVTDFGLAQVQTDSRLTLTGDLVGTLRYMSPEQALARGNVDHRTDLYSLGATLYELLTLKPAFRGHDRQELLRQIAFEEPKPLRRVNKTIPADLETIVLKAMAKSPAERYATAAELADDLRRFLEDKPIRARRPSWLEQSRKWGRRHRPAVWSAATTLLVALLIFAAIAGWVVRDHAARRTRIATEIHFAISDSRQFQKQGKLPEAQAAARHAKSLLVSSEHGQELHDLLQELVKDLGMLAAAEQVRLLRTGVMEGHFDSGGAAEAYALAFRDYGIDVEALDAREAAKRIGERLIRSELVAVLDGWAETRRWSPQRGHKSWEDLLAIAQAADDDPSRAALRHELLRGDDQALVERAMSDESRSLPPATVILLAERLRAENLEQATVLLRRAQERHPGDFWINQTLADCLFDGGADYWDDAITFFTVSVAVRPESPGARLNLGVALSTKGRLDEAIAAYHRAIELKPDYAHAWSNLSSALEKAGQLDEALAAGRQAVELQPDLATAHNSLGFVFWKAGRLEEALTAFRQAIHLCPSFATAHYNSGVILLEKGQLDVALAAFQQAILLKPDYALAYQNTGNVLARQCRFDEAVAAYRKAIERDPDRAGTYYALGKALIDLGRFDESTTALGRALEIQPGFAEVHCDLGFVHWKTGRLDEAAAAFGQAIQLKPDLHLAHANLGNVLMMQGRLEAAIAACRKAIELKPDLAVAHYNLGAALHRQGHVAAAVAAYRQAVQLEPGYAMAHYRLGTILEKQGRLREALAALRKAVEFKPDHASAHYNLGTTLLQIGQGDEAAAALRRAVALKPDMAEAHCNLGLALGRHGEFDQGLSALQRGHELGSQRPKWSYPSASWVETCQRLTALANRLPAILQGQTQPADASEWNEFGRLCFYQQLYAASARFRLRAFAADPKLADDLQAGHRYEAACAAAMAGCGQGTDAHEIDDGQRARCRQQAFQWLRADLEAYRKSTEDSSDENQSIQRRLRGWQDHRALAGLRDADAVATLPAEEQEACKQFWEEVRALLTIDDPAE